MGYPSVFEKNTTQITFERLEKLTKDSTPLWGKMNVAQMMAHLNVSYDVAIDKIEVKNNFFMKLMLKLMVKNTVVGEAPYKKSSMTAPYFVQDGICDFETEKAKFIANVQAVEIKGKEYFNGKESVSFGVMSDKEWSVLFYKHLGLT